MPNEKHFEIIKQGVEEWNKWRGENPEIEPDLSDIDLSDMKLNNAQERWLKDAIRDAYDTGYNDARTNKAASCDGAAKLFDL